MSAFILQRHTHKFIIFFFAKGLSYFFYKHYGRLSFIGVSDMVLCVLISVVILDVWILAALDSSLGAYPEGFLWSKPHHDQLSLKILWNSLATGSYAYMGSKNWINSVWGLSIYKGYCQNQTSLSSRMASQQTKYQWSSILWRNEGFNS